MYRVLAIAVLMLVSACGRQDAATRPAGLSQRQSAIAWLRTARFEDADPASDCRPDCHEQERGFDFARNRRIEQPGDCDLERVRAGASEDFIEGCRAYGQYLEAAERQR